MKYGTRALALVLGLFLAGGVANAQLTGAVDMAVDVGGSADTSFGDEGTAGGSSGAGVSGSAGTGVSGSGSVGSDDASVSSDTSAGGILDFSVTRRSLSADSSGNGSVSSAAEVSSNESFRAYAESALKSDEQFDSVDVSKDGMEVSYKRPARFLGFIPASLRVKVHVDGNGDVSVKYPWYSFLMASGESREDLEARLTADLSTIAADSTLDQASGGVAVSGSAAASANGSLESRRWARALERVQAALSADAGAEASAQ